MIAKYYRLSTADGDLGKDGKDVSNSIESQRLLIAGYMASREEFCGQSALEYVDDGYTGTNFARPGFEHMMEDVRFGKIDTVIVKDMSRFGRDYIGVGDYLEQIFPVLGVRFIAVNNNYDSSKYKGTTMGTEMAIGNIVNTMYSRDIAKKLKTSNRTRWNSGYRTCGTPPFGYMPNPEIKGRYIVDPEAGAIVRRIFDLALEGKRTGRIAYCLNEEEMPVPSAYYRRRMVKGKSNHYKIADEIIWDSTKVRRIIQNYEYTGALVLGKRQTLITGSTVSRAVPERERVICEGVNEGIVTIAEFEKAQSVIRTQKKIEFYTEHDYPLKGKIRCGSCGRAMVTKPQSPEPKFWCEYGREMKKHCKCGCRDYPMKKVEDAVRREIYAYCRALADLNGKIAAYKAEANADKAEKVREIDAADGQMKSLAAEKMHLYERYAEGKATEEEYKKERTALEEKMLMLDAKRAEMRKANEIEPLDAALCAFIEDAKGLEAKTEKSAELTREEVEKTVDAVYIYGDEHMEVKLHLADAVRDLEKTLSGG